MSQVNDADSERSVRPLIRKAINVVLQRHQTMAEIEFTNEQKDVVAAKLKKYILEELDRDLGQFELEFLLDFLVAELGPFFYNQGLYDAKALIEKRVEDITESIYELEK